MVIPQMVEKKILYKINFKFSFECLNDSLSSLSSFNVGAKQLSKGVISWGKDEATINANENKPNCLFDSLKIIINLSN